MLDYSHQVAVREKYVFEKVSWNYLEFTIPNIFE